MKQQRNMENEVAQKPKRKKAKSAPENNGHENGQINGERKPERDTRPIAEIRSGNIMARIWANPDLVGSYTYRFRFSRVTDYQKSYFHGGDADDAIVAAKMVKRFILRHRWRTFFRN